MFSMVNTLLRFSLEMFVKSSEEHEEDINHLEEAINFLDLTLVKRDQCIHCPVQILACQRGYPVQFLNNFHNGGS